MSNDEGKPRTSSSEQSTPSDPPTAAETLSLMREILPGLKETLLVARMQSEGYERLQARVAWLTRLEASKAEHVLQLAAAKSAEAESRDRQTEAVLLLTQKFTEFDGDLKYARAGVDAIYKAVNNDVKLKAALQKAIARGVREGSKAAVREASQSIALQRREEDAATGRIGAVTRLVRVVDGVRPATKVLMLVFALLAAACAGGWLFVELHKVIDDPRGAPVERALGHRPQGEAGR